MRHSRVPGVPGVDSSEWNVNERTPVLAGEAGVAESMTVSGVTLSIVKVEFQTAAGSVSLICSALIL